MKKTKTLKVSVSVAVAQDHLVLHPNEGFDLGLMRVGHPLRLCSNIPIEDYLRGSDGESFNVHVDLLNECPKETMLIGVSLHRLLGAPGKAVVLADGERLYVHRNPG